MAILYQPVVRASAGSYRGTALVGTHSAVIGWTLEDPALRDGLLGFAIRRTEMDPATDEVMRVRWLGGYKRFTATDDGRTGEVSSLTAPFQRFRWNDYTLKATRSYLYEVFPMRGTPAALTREEAPLAFALHPSAEEVDGLGSMSTAGSHRPWPTSPASGTGTPRRWETPPGSGCPGD